MLVLHAELRQRIDTIEDELRRLHPETITPTEWLKLRRMVLDILETNRQLLRLVNESNRQEQQVIDELVRLKTAWAQQSEMSLLSLILSRLRRR